MEGVRPVKFYVPTETRNEFGEVIRDYENDILDRSAIRPTVTAGRELNTAEANFYSAGAVKYIVRWDDGLTEIGTDWKLLDVKEGWEYEILAADLHSKPSGESRWHIMAKRTAK